MATTKKRAHRTLAHGRPPTARLKPKSMSRKATKSLINAHHVLEKRKMQASAKGDKTEVAAIEAEMAALGGIEKYQQASLQGQRGDRGGDSSRILLDWLKPVLPALKGMPRLRMLEVGALSTTNECSKSGLFSMERIDLNSQDDGILQQDFMERPLPTADAERFDVISLSLVLNFVPEADGRGRMLQRTLEFLRVPKDCAMPQTGELFPCLFLVLPAPCVTNSRYMDEDLMEALMSSLGYKKKHSKTTNKLVYYLWTRTRDHAEPGANFGKKELRSGASRNNFAVVMRVAPG